MIPFWKKNNNIQKCVSWEIQNAQPVYNLNYKNNQSTTEPETNFTQEEMTSFSDGVHDGSYDDTPQQARENGGRCSH